jgi:hypothetical protein
VRVHAYLYVSHFASAATPRAGATRTWETVAWVAAFALFLACAIALAVIETFRGYESDDGDDDWRPGRGGPEPPHGDPGPSGADPMWWPEFERQFAAYVERSANGGYLPSASVPPRISTRAPTDTGAEARAVDLQGERVCHKQSPLFVTHNQHKPPRELWRLR